MAEKDEARQGDGGARKGSVSVVGIGPGELEHLTPRASRALAEADAIVGYTRYMELVAPLTGGKELYSTGMTREVERCEKAVGLAALGRRVAVVSSGDSGIYGMAGVVLSLAARLPQGPRPAVEVIPGVPAFVSAAALLGAPLMHDFASISLSDLLTPWETIAARLEAAAKADFVIILYNPKSTRRTEGLPKALDIIMAARPAGTPAGIVRNASRPDEWAAVTTLGGLSGFHDSIDMFTIILIGNSTTFTADGKMITPRGYREL